MGDREEGVRRDVSHRVTGCRPGVGAGGSCPPASLRRPPYPEPRGSPFLPLQMRGRAPKERVRVKNTKERGDGSGTEPEGAPEGGVGLGAV